MGPSRRDAASWPIPAGTGLYLQSVNEPHHRELYRLFTVIDGVIAIQFVAVRHSSK